MNNKTLEQLIRDRKELIEAHRKNNFTEGIHALLTDLYPDAAHFIYELLQNAEDMNATVVHFTLNKNSIEFEHNGTKRDFNIKDIDAITSIGHNSQKKDDPTSIGKFGVGFKAVFAYTATPIIHSGKYHFKIVDYFVPDNSGIEKVNTIDKDGIAWTKFSFPFNNPKKPTEIAYNECLNGLRELNSTTILFLQNIKKIEYVIRSENFGYVELADDGNHRFTVTLKKANGSMEEKTRWLRFDRMVKIIDDQGNPKNMSIAVAFALGYDEGLKKDVILPVKGGGRTFIYFPAEKEYSGLRFHINAPFASTVARDSVRNCNENNKLIRDISKLIVESLPIIKAQGLMNHSFFSTLPNEKDSLNDFYKCIFDDIFVTFQNNAYLPTQSGDYTSAKKALIGSSTISNVIKDDDVSTLFNIYKKWIKNAPLRNSYADNFIQSLGIQTFTFEDFATIFNSNIREKTELLLAGRENDWLKLFYALCADTCDNLHSYYERNSFIQNMKQSLAIKSTKGSMHYSSDIYFLPVNAKLITNTTPIVEQSFVLESSRSDRYNEKIREFFQNRLEIQEYGPKVEVEKLLRTYEDGITVNDKYFSDLITFAKYRQDHEDIDFSGCNIFLYQSSEDDDNQYIACASELFLGKPYENNNVEILATTYNKHCLWSGYAEHYSEESLKVFKSFVSKIGMSKGLTIVEHNVKNHPNFWYDLHSNARETDYAHGSDYTIQGLELLLKKQSIDISKHIWKTLEQYGKNSWNSYATARFSPNNSAPTRFCDSTLIYYLKKYAWIPNKQGKLFKPEDITLSELNIDFAYDSRNSLLSALKIGSTAEKNLKAEEKWEQEAKRAGKHILSDEEYCEYQKLKAQKEKVNNTVPLSAKELLSKQQRTSVPSVNADDSFATDGAVNNVSRREKNIEDTFRNAKQMKPAQRKLFGRIIESTKEEKNILRNWYQGICQMCNTVIIGYNQKPHFIAKNIISTQHLSAAIRQTTHIAWNSLCLCPNCSAKYNVCSRDLSGLFEQIMLTEIIEGDIEKIVLTIELDGKQQEIHYIPKHFLALKTVMKLIEDEAK